MKQTAILTLFSYVRRSCAVLGVLLAFVGVSGGSFAQDSVVVPDASTGVGAEAGAGAGAGNAALSVAQPDASSDASAREGIAPVLVPGQEILPDTIPSVLFTFWEHEAIIDAKTARGAVRPSTQSEMENSAGINDLEGRPKPPPEKRYITLGGIVYTSQSDWIIWLNGQQVTPNAIPKEVLDLRVFNQYIEVKWLDDYTNQIFPIRLRPHQRFNVDTRIFLPG